MICNVKAHLSLSGSSGPWSSGRGPQPPPQRGHPGWSSQSSGAAPPQAAQNNSAASSSEVQMLMNQVRQLQQKVQEMSQQGGDDSGNGAGNYDAFQPNETRILLVSNLPQSLATCDAIYFMFER